MLVPCCGHFGSLPKILSAAYDADSGQEAIDELASAFERVTDDGEEFLSAVLDSFPALLSITSTLAEHLDTDVEDSGSSAKVQYDQRTSTSIFWRVFCRGQSPGF